MIATNCTSNNTFTTTTNDDDEHNDDGTAVSSRVLVADRRAGSVRLQGGSYFRSATGDCARPVWWCCRRRPCRQQDIGRRSRLSGVYVVVSDDDDHDDDHVHFDRVIGIGRQRRRGRCRRVYVVLDQQLGFQPHRRPKPDEI